MKELIDIETGEIIKVNTLDDLKRKKIFAEKKQSDNLFQNMQSEIMGNFIFFMYNNLDKLEKKLSDADLVKFMYLATYIKKDDYLMNNNNTYIDKRQMKKLLLCGKNVFTKFYKNIIDSKFIILDNGKYKVDTKFIYKGSNKHYKELNGVKLYNYARLYINATRLLYIQNHKKPKKLAIAYKLLPYVNWKYNILAKDVYTQDIEKLKPLTIQDVMDILGYDKIHTSRFKDDFYGINYSNNVLFKTVQSKPRYRTSYIYINPRFSYRGNNVDDLDKILGIFKVK